MSAEPQGQGPLPVFFHQVGGKLAPCVPIDQAIHDLEERAAHAHNAFMRARDAGEPRVALLHSMKGSTYDAVVSFLRGEDDWDMQEIRDLHAENDSRLQEAKGRLDGLAGR